LCFQAVARLRSWLIDGLPRKETAESAHNSPWSDANLTLWVAAYADSRSLAACVASSLAARIGAALDPTESSPLPGPVSAALEACSSEVERDMAHPVEEHIVRSVTRACVGQL